MDRLSKEHALDSLFFCKECKTINSVGLFSCDHDKVGFGLGEIIPKAEISEVMSKGSESECVDSLIKSFDKEELFLKRLSGKISINDNPRLGTTVLMEDELLKPLTPPPNTQQKNGTTKEEIKPELNEMDSQSDMSSDQTDRNERLSRVFGEVENFIKLRETYKPIVETLRTRKPEEDHSGAVLECYYVLCEYCNNNRYTSRVNTSWENFMAYPGADKHPEVRAALESTPSENVGNGIWMSTPYVISSIKTRGEYILASISHHGIFVAYSDDTDFLEFYDLILGNTARIRGMENWSIAAFVDEDAMIVLTDGEQIRKGSVKEVFEGQGDHESNILKPIQSKNKIYKWADVSLVNETREIIFSDRLHKISVYNVDDDKITHLGDRGRLALQFGGLTGIKSSKYRGVFRGHFDGKLYGLLGSGDVEEIFGHNTGYSISLIIPSQSDPMNVDKAMKFFDNGKYYLEGKTANTLTHPVAFQHSVSIVRICRDVFIMYDEESQKWMALRIIVP